MKNKNQKQIKKLRGKYITRKIRRREKLNFIIAVMIITSTIIAIALIPVALAKGEDELAYLHYFPFPEEREMGLHGIRVDTANKIRAIAKSRNFKWPQYAVNICCEESLLGTERENTKGNMPSYSVDRGPYGINDYWHEEISDECAHDLECATNFFMDMVEAGRQHEWVSDKKVKGKPDYSLIKCGVR